MSRLSRNIDQVLLPSGRVLYPAHGCADLSLRPWSSRRAIQFGIVPALLADAVQNHVRSDAGIAQRVDDALWALTHRSAPDNLHATSAKDASHG